MDAWQTQNKNRSRRPLLITRASRFDVDEVGAFLVGRPRLRLTVFRPGITRRDRIFAAVYGHLVYRSGWVGLVGVGMIILPVNTDAAGSVWLRLLNGALLAAGGALVSWMLARQTIAEAHQLVAHVEWQTGQMVPFVNELSALERADLTPVAHEHEWGRIYTRLAPATSGQES